MKFMSILLSEGRKDDLKKKYSNKFQDYPDTLDFVLGIADLADSNYKYTDFVLKNLHPNSSTDEIEDAVELVKDFEQFSNKLEIKDINQYKSFEQLQDAILKLKEIKGPKPKADKIYEDDTFVVLIPKNEEASCKYGSNTKWCVTSKGSGHFERYTSGGQGLYFIINKKNSTNDYYSKVAVHVDSNGRFSYWDSKDNRMDIKEIKILEYAFPEIIDSIKQDAASKKDSKIDIFTKEVFDNYSSGESSEERNYLGTDLTLEVFIEGFENIEHIDNHAAARVAIQLYTNETGRLLDSYEVFIVYKALEPKLVETRIGFNGIDPSESWDYIDLGLENFDIEAKFMMQDTPQETARVIRRYLTKRILDEIKRKPELIKKVKGDGTFWKPNRASYGYTFKQNKGLVKKLINYLDSGYDNGTKADFLDYIGKIERRTTNGKPEYTIKGQNFWRPINDLRGYFSSFFASAKLAGIIQYQKEGNKYIIKPGPNFDAFKSGELKAL